MKTYWINCTKFTADGRKIGPLSSRITLPTSPLKARISALPFTGYHCHLYASNDVGNGPFSRNVTVPPVPVGKYSFVQLYIYLTMFNKLFKCERTSYIVLLTVIKSLYFLVKLRH